MADCHRIHRAAAAGKATVLVLRPDVLLLDEPTYALDPENEERWLVILQALPQAILLVSHDPAVCARPAQCEDRQVNGQLSDNS